MSHTHPDPDHDHEDDSERGRGDGRSVESVRQEIKTRSEWVITPADCAQMRLRADADDVTAKELAADFDSIDFRTIYFHLKGECKCDERGPKADYPREFPPPVRFADGTWTFDSPDDADYRPPPTEEVHPLSQKNPQEIGADWIDAVTCTAIRVRVGDGTPPETLADAIDLDPQGVEFHLRGFCDCDATEPPRRRSRGRWIAADDRR